ncbi:MAG: DNA/RNA non-specific endonuclease [Firmicutes bacterium]|nr:DNA/RNA non-specific endonuclease [Bacillota bacterium]
MRKRILPWLLVLAMLFSAAGCSQESGGQVGQSGDSGQASAVLENIPDYSGEPYIAINDNEPDFEEEDFTEESFETYSELDSLGRCGEAFANIGRDLMPSEKRGSIGQVKPSGWKTVKYDFVDGKYLYNRCHLIGYQLTAENANERNLITGTRYMNVQGMLPFENMVADYIKETGNHVLYRVRPVFEGDNLVASGVQMEAESVEDQGESISFNVYVYNNQQGVDINYATGESALSGQEPSASSIAQIGSSKASKSEHEENYVINTNTGKFHKPSCYSTADIKPSNKKTYKGSRSDLLKQGYEPCGNCHP